MSATSLQCYCKLVHLARTTPTSLCENSLKFFDEEVRLCLTSCLAIDMPDPQRQQAQLSPTLGGQLSLHSLVLDDNTNIQLLYISHTNSSIG